MILVIYQHASSLESRTVKHEPELGSYAESEFKRGTYVENKAKIIFSRSKIRCDIRNHITKLLLSVTLPPQHQEKMKKMREDHSEFIFAVQGYKNTRDEILKEILGGMPEFRIQQKEHVEAIEKLLEEEKEKNKELQKQQTTITEFDQREELKKLQRKTKKEQEIQNTIKILNTRTNNIPTGELTMRYTQPFERIEKKQKIEAEIETNRIRNRSMEKNRIQRIKEQELTKNKTQNILSSQPPKENTYLHDNILTKEENPIQTINQTQNSQQEQEAEEFRNTLETLEEKIKFEDQNLN